MHVSPQLLENKAQVLPTCQPGRGEAPARPHCPGPDTAQATGLDAALHGGGAPATHLSTTPQSPALGWVPAGMGARHRAGSAPAPPPAAEPSPRLGRVLRVFPHTADSENASWPHGSPTPSPAPRPP